jgi:hypothetical protein
MAQQSKNDTVLQDVKNFIRNFKSLNETIFAGLIEDTHFFNLETLLYEFDSSNGSITIEKIRNEINNILKLNLEINNIYVIDLVLKQIEGSDHIKITPITAEITDDDGNTTTVITGIKISVKDICLLIKECPVIIEILQDIKDIKIDITEIQNWLEDIELSIFNIENNITVIEGDITNIYEELDKTAEEKYTFESPNNSITGGFVGNKLSLETDGKGGSGNPIISTNSKQEAINALSNLPVGTMATYPTESTDGSGDGSTTPSGPVDWSDIQNKPTTFNPTAHSHTQNEITGLQSALDGKANSTHTHTASQVGLGNVNNLQQIPMSQRGAVNGVATLDASGKLTASQMPDVNGGSTYTVITSITNATNANVILTRSDNLITMFIRGTKSSGNNAISFTIPTGYRPNTAVSAGAMRVGTGDMTITVSTAGAFATNSVNITGNFTTSMAWVTNDAMP